MSHFATHGLIEVFKIGWPYLWVVWPFLTYAMTKDGKPELAFALTALAIVGIWFLQSDPAWLSGGFVAGALAYAAPAWIGARLGARRARRRAGDRRQHPRHPRPHRVAAPARAVLLNRSAVGVCRLFTARG